LLICAVALVRAARAAEAPGGGAVTVLQGQVVFGSGAPLEGVTVFALDRDGEQITAAASSDHQGRVSLTIPRSREVVLGATSARFELQRLEVLDPARFRLVMSVMPSELFSLDPAAAVGTVTISPLVPAPAGGHVLGALRAAVVDEAGGPLAGVRVTMYGESASAPVATTLTDTAGHCLLVAPPGRYRLRPTAPGLKPARLDTERARPLLVMAVETRPETIQIADGGKVLSFRLDDSIDPEYYPPPAAKAWLKFRYCLDVDRMFRRASVNYRFGPRPLHNKGERPPFGGGMDNDPRPALPISYAARQLNLEKYWWLKKLYTDPPGTCHHFRRVPRPLIPW
jgi:hypothetical protein